MKKFYDAHAKWNEIDDDPMTFGKKQNLQEKRCILSCKSIQLMVFVD